LEGSVDHNTVSLVPAILILSPISAMAKVTPLHKSGNGPSTAKTSSATAGPSRKRPASGQAPSSDEEDDELELNGAQLVAEDDEDVDAEDDEEYEIDTGSSNGDLGDFQYDRDEEEGEELDSLRKRRDGDDEFTDSSDDADFEDDEADDGEDDEEGYNSSDIDALSSPSTSVSSRSRSSNFKAGSPTLDELIARHTVKPSESASALSGYVRSGANVDGTTYSAAKSGKGKLVPSKLVKGGWKREYEDIEAGYGSESSTEDVSGFACIATRENGRINAEWRENAGCGRTRTRSATFPWNGTMISLTLGTRSTGKRS
jgi:ribosome biogenesis protein ERB1